MDGYCYRLRSKLGAKLGFYAWPDPGRASLVLEGHSFCTMKVHSADYFLPNKLVASSTLLTPDPSLNSFLRRPDGMVCIS